MNRYHTAKIYQILNSVDSEEYIGSTCKKYLSERMRNHRAACKAGKQFKLYNHMRQNGVKTFFIQLLEAYSCNSRDELTKREGYWINQRRPSLNQNVAGRSVAELYQVQKQDRVEYQKEYRRQHSEAIKNSKSIKIACECGSLYVRNNKHKHNRTDKHQAYETSGGLNLINV